MSLNPSSQVVCLHCDQNLASEAEASSQVRNYFVRGASLIAISMTLSACYGGPPARYNQCIDQDRDGYCLPYDCNDHDPNQARNCSIED